jgi:Asp-tRNA(Asn)/Glu-tRNA(Gln) amidotransferase A subunit family amidase
VGSDSGGSTRIPAATCGVVGLKLTARSVPVDGYTGVNNSMSAPGALCRDAADARLLASVLLDRPLAAGSARELRVAVVGAPYGDVDPEVAAACASALDVSRWARTDVDLDVLGDATIAGLIRLIVDAGGGPPPLFVLDAADEMTRGLALYGSLFLARHVARSDRVRALVRRTLVDLFADHDVVAWPTLAGTAPPVADARLSLPSGPVPADIPNVHHNIVGNLAGVPGISVPVGFDGQGLPIGLELLAPWGSEATLLDAAEHLEMATGRAHVDAAPALAS